MTAFTLLKQAPGQKIARPFNRTCSFDETIAILAYHDGFQSFPGTDGQKRAHAKVCMDRAENLPEEMAEALGWKAKNIDTDLPVCILGRDKFYAYTEE
jgi:hypothetical protein